VIPSELTTSSIAHLSTAKRMSAILQECGALNNARTVDEAFHPSKRFTPRAANKAAAALEFLSADSCDLSRPRGHTLHRHGETIEPGEC
jgi:hypothetical protein